MFEYMSAQEAAENRMYHLGGCNGYVKKIELKAL